METPGQIVKNAREAKKLSQKQLAAEVGISQPALALIELDKRAIDPDYRYLLCNVLGLNVNRLVFAEAQKFGFARLTFAELTRGAQLQADAA